MAAYACVVNTFIFITNLHQGCAINSVDIRNGSIHSEKHCNLMFTNIQRISRALAAELSRIIWNVLN